MTTHTMYLNGSKPHKLLIDAIVAAEMLSVSPRSLWEWTKAGKIPHVRLGRRVLYSPKDIEVWIENNKQVGEEARA